MTAPCGVPRALVVVLRAAILALLCVPASARADDDARSHATDAGAHAAPAETDAGSAEVAGHDAASSPEAAGQSGEPEAGEAAPEAAGTPESEMPPAPLGPLDRPSVTFSPIPLLEGLPPETDEALAAVRTSLLSRLERTAVELEALRAALAAAPPAEAATPGIKSEKLPDPPVAESPEPTEEAARVEEAPPPVYVPSAPPPGPGRPYFPMEPAAANQGRALRDAVAQRADELRKRLGGAEAREAALDVAISTATTRWWACSAGGVACEALRRGIDTARDRVAVHRLEVQVTEAELQLIAAQRDHLDAVLSWARAEEDRRSVFEDAQRAAEQAVARAAAERAAAERAEREAQELQARREVSRAAMDRAKAEQQEFLRQQRAAEERKRQHDRELADIYQRIVDVTSEMADDIERLSEQNAELDAARARARAFVDTALRDDVHVRGLVRKVRAGELDPEVLDVRHEETVRRLARIRLALSASREDEATAELTNTKAVLRSANGDVEVFETASEGDPALAKKRLELARLLADRADTGVRIASARLDQVNVERALHKAERIFYSSQMRRVAPALSQAYRAKLLAMNPSFVDGLMANVVDLGDRLSDRLGTRMEDVWALPDRVTSLAVVTNLLVVTGEALLLLIVALWIRRRLPQWLYHLVKGAGANPWLRSHLLFVVSLAKIVSAVGRPAVILAALAIASSALGSEIPEVVAAVFVLRWIFVWRMLIAFARVLFLPSDPPPPGSPETVSSIDASPVLRLPAPIARIAYRSTWMVVHYVVTRVAVLWAVEELLGRLYLYRALGILFDLGAVVLALYLMLAWRSQLLSRFASVAPPTWARTQRWVRKNQDRLLGVLAVPFVLVWLLLVRAGPFLKAKARESTFSRSLANYFLRRRMERATTDADGEVRGMQRASEGLPDEYVRYFRLAPLQDEPYLVEPLSTLASVLQAREHWKAGRSPGAAAVIGEQGLGKTTLLHQVARAVGAADVRWIRFDRKAHTERELVAQMGRALGLHPEPVSVGQLTAAITALPESTLLVDDAHHLYLKVIGGLQGLDAFFKVIAATSHAKMWVTTFDSYAWYFITRLERGHLPFTGVFAQPRWTDERIQQLVTQRTDAAGYRITFEDLVVARGEGSAATYQVVKTAEGYFRLLTDYAAGNPAVALGYWLRSLTPRGPRQLSVGLFARRSIDGLLPPGDEVLFTLTAIAEHGGLPVPALGRVLGYEPLLVERIVQSGVDGGILARVGEGADKRVVLHFDSFRQVVAVLRSKNFIYFESKE